MKELLTEFVTKFQFTKEEALQVLSLHLTDNKPLQEAIDIINFQRLGYTPMEISIMSEKTYDFIKENSVPRHKLPKMMSDVLEYEVTMQFIKEDR